MTIYQITQGYARYYFDEIDGVKDQSVGYGRAEIVNSTKNRVAFGSINIYNNNTEIHLRFLRY